MNTTEIKDEVAIKHINDFIKKEMSKNDKETRYSALRKLSLIIESGKNAFYDAVIVEEFLENEEISMYNEATKGRVFFEKFKKKK